MSKTTIDVIMSLEPFLIIQIALPFLIIQIALYSGLAYPIIRRKGRSLSGPTSRGGFCGFLHGASHKTASQPMAERGRTGTTELKTGCALQHPVPIVDVRGASRPSAFGIFSENFEASAFGRFR